MNDPLLALLSFVAGALFNATIGLLTSEYRASRDEARLIAREERTADRALESEHRASRREMILTALDQTHRQLHANLEYAYLRARGLATEDDVPPYTGDRYPAAHPRWVGDVELLARYGDLVARLDGYEPGELREEEARDLGREVTSVIVSLEDVLLAQEERARSDSPVPRVSLSVAEDRRLELEDERERLLGPEAPPWRWRSRIHPVPRTGAFGDQPSE